jgi:hypothetical protein
LALILLLNVPDDGPGFYINLSTHRNLP